MYKWLREGELPSGFLGHMVGIASAYPRIMFDYFVLIAKGEWTFEDLIEAISPRKCLLFLLLTEYQVHMAEEDTLDEDLRQFYLEKISEFKAEVLSQITRAEKEAFNNMFASLLLETGN